MTNELHVAPQPRRPARCAVLGAAALLASGCASKQAVRTVWPPPPETARIEHVRTFSKPEHLDPGLWQRIVSALVPRESGAEVQSPSGLALSPDERRLYVACGGQGRVVVLDREKQTLSPILPKGPKTTTDVALDADENLYVSDRVTNGVYVYDRKGAFLRKIGEGVLDGPTSVAVDRRGQQLYVASGRASGKKDHRVDVFSLAGAHLRTLGQRGEGPGEFNFPSALFVAPDGSLYVSDMLNFRVQQFDPTGQLLASFGQIGVGLPGAFDKIKGIALDAFKNVYVVDSMQGVHILNPSFQPLMLFAGPPFMATPGPIVIDSRNRIFVADFSMNVVHEFQLVNTTAADSYAPGGSSPAPAGATGSGAAPGDAPRPEPAPADRPAGAR